MHVDQAKKIVGQYSYFLRDKLGTGSSSEVYRGLSLKTTEPVAVKVIPLANVERDSVGAAATSETDLLKKLKDCTNIIQIKSAIHTKHNLYIVTELCEGGCLEARLTHLRRMDEETAVAVMEQVIAACKQLINHGVVHRDIKPSNILIKGSQYKLADFGYAIAAELCNKPQRDNVGSPSYMPLESLQLNRYSHQSDFWALGIVFFQLLTGRTPWKSRTEKDLVKQIQSFQLHNVMPKVISAVSKKFLERTLVLNVEKRMSKEEFMQWNFQLPSLREEGTSSVAKLKNHLLKPLRNTYDLHQMENLRTILNNKSSIQLHQHPNTPKNDAQLNLEQRFCKVKSKRVDSILEQGIKNELAGTAHTITASNERSLSKDISKTVLDFSKTASTLITRPKAESFTARELLPNGKDCPYQIDGVILQLQAQLDYCRFLLRVLRRLSDSLRTKDKRVLELKQALFYFVHLKMAQIKDLRFIKATNAQKQTFLASPQYNSVLTLLGKYRERAKQEGSKFGQGLAARTEKEFISTLVGVMGLLYSNVVPLRDNPQQLDRRRAVVLILEDLIALYELFMLQREEHWMKFKQSSNIAAHLGRTTPEAISLAYFQAVQANFIKLAQT